MKKCTVYMFVFFRLAPRRSRVRTPDEANFPPVGLKKSLSLCLPQGMALMGMSQDSEVFFRDRRSHCLVLMKYDGAVSPRPVFYMLVFFLKRLDRILLFFPLKARSTLCISVLFMSELNSCVPKRV